MGGREAAPRFLRLLLDEMHDPHVAERLRGEGHDVVAVAEIPELRGMSDPDLIMCATLDGRALVTENVKDFAPLHASMIATNASHAGVVLAHRGRFPRSRPDASSRLSSALSQFLNDVPSGLEGTSFLWWLEPVS